uniref:Uncharacterized protein n=1 Tax=Zea mays TaxID=4577 RepID=A0A804ULP2_MAIZE
MLAFEDNGSSKIGVRLDKQIPDGNDLGGLCEEDHGFFCSAESLRPDFSASEEVERLAMTELIEVISEENKSGPLIVLLGCREIIHWSYRVTFIFAEQI